MNEEKSDLDRDLPSTARHEIVTELSDEMKLKLEIVESLMEKCDRATYSKKLKKAAKKLGKSKRTVQRLVKKWQEEGIAGLKGTERNDKGQHRISEAWQDFIINTYREGNKGSRKMSRQQVAVRVKNKARELGEKKYPNYRTVYRVLQPIIDAQESLPKIRSVGWRGSSLSVKTRNGNYIDVEYSNHVWQCDHTKVDILLASTREAPRCTDRSTSYGRGWAGFNLVYFDFLYISSAQIL
jgi:putative transposase